jgi:hypothetical protein
MNITKPTTSSEQCVSARVSSDSELTPSELDEKYNPAGGGEHPDHTRSEWREAVAQDLTLSGYWEWVAHTLSL